MNREDYKAISFPCIKVAQPVGEFYVGVMKWRDLCDIARFDIRRIVREREVEKYLGIERPLNKKRVEEIKRYVNTLDATFPTSIILAVEAVCARIDEERGIMTLSNYVEVGEEEEPIYFRDIARILDGQHRIAGLEGFEEENFDLTVTIFISVDIAVQANIFSIVNLAQTKVSRSLAYDLFSLAKSRSPQKTCHNISVALDQNENTPFYHRIKRLGVATEGRFGETLSQATVVQSLLRYISVDPMLDRDELLRGRKLKLVGAEESERLIFRNMFIEQKELEIADIIWNFFESVRRKWPEAWESSGRGNMLNKTNGFKAFMRFLKPAYLYFTLPGGKVAAEQFSEIMDRIKLSERDFNIERFKPGTSGESELYRELMQQSRLG